MKKLNLHLIEDKLIASNIKIFSPQDLKIIFGVSQRAVEGFLNYNLKKGAFVRLKKGLYAIKRNLPSDFLCANKIYSPSYISLETALSYYNLIPETIYSITSVTSKATREFLFTDRLFEYRKIKRKAYAGYVPKTIDGEVVLIATPERAAVDFLYFVFLGKKSFNERLHFDKLNFKQLKKQAGLFGQKRFLVFLERTFPK